MNNIVITNDGLIEVEDLMLIGSSTKRNDSNKIGMFGSGWKYALAWLLRNDIDIKIYSGLEEIKISTVPVKHRTNEVDVITINKQKTSLTTDMGPKWTGWMALREIVSNAIDEGGDTVEMGWNLQAIPQENITKIQISVNSELSEVMNKYEHYFAFKRKETESNNIARLFLKYELSPINIYRKGIRCYNDDNNYKSMIDIDFNRIDIDENRLTTLYNIQNKVKDMFLNQPISKEIFLGALLTTDYDFLPVYLNDRLLSICKLLYDDGYNYITKGEIELIGRMSTDDKTLVVPNTWFKDLKDAKILESKMQLLFGSYSFSETNNKSIDGVKYYLSAINCNIDVKFGKLSGYNNVVFDNSLKTAYVNDEISGSDLSIAAQILQKCSKDIFEDILSK